MWSWARSLIPAIRATSGSVAAQTRDLVVSLVPSWLENWRWLIGSVFLSLAQKGYAGSPLVYACLRLLSQSIAEPPLVIYQKDRDGNLAPVAPDSPLAQLLVRPNELMTQYEMVELISVHMGIAGQSFWWKLRANNGTVESLWPLRPDRVGPVYSSSNNPGERLLRGWVYQIPGTGEYYELPRADVIAFNLPDPSGESGGIVEGLGPLQVLAREVGADNEATNFVGTLLANYAQPSWAIKVKKAIQTKEEAQSIKQRFMRQYGGAKRGEPAILDDDTELTQLSFNLKDLEFPVLRDVSESRITSAFGVPAIMVGFNVGLKAGIRATIKEQREYFTETTLAGWWRRLEDQLNGDLAREFGDDLVVMFDISAVKALAGQRLSAIGPIKEGYAAGVVMVNEYRRVLGLDRVAGGDVFIRPLNVVEVLAEAESIVAGKTKEKFIPKKGPALGPPEKVVITEGDMDAASEVFDRSVPEKYRGMIDAKVEGEETS